MTKDPDTDQWRHPSEASLRAMTEKEQLLCVISEMRHGFSKQFRDQARVNEAFQNQLSEGGKIMAILTMQVKELAKDMAETDGTVKKLEGNDWARSVNELNQEKINQPKQYSIAVTAAIIAAVTLLVNGMAFLVYNIIRTTPGVTP